MKYALIGCGMISAAHLKAARETGLEIAALCDLNEENARKALAQLPEEESSSTAVYTDYRKMLDEVRPELVALALGSGVKRAIACDCLAAGANVIVEKPIALSLSDADAMIAAARENGVKLCVNHQLRFCPSVRAVKAAVEDGAFGQMYHAAAQVRRNRNQAYFDAAYRLGKLLAAGGHTLVFGGGLSMVLEAHLMAPGIVMGCCGIAVMAAMPAFYERLLKRERQKAAPRVAELLKRVEKRE